VGISETCSVCGGEFDVQFRYQMEERDGGFSFYCSQKCLEKSQVTGADQGGSAAVTCDACAKRFQPDLVSQVLYLGGAAAVRVLDGVPDAAPPRGEGVRLGGDRRRRPVAPRGVASARGWRGRARRGVGRVNVPDDGVGEVLRWCRR
jgi:chromosome partitioning protein